MGRSRGPRPKRSLGQHFLVDPRYQRRIVEALEAGAGDEVVEVGPGHGELTRHLAGTVRRLVVVELDDLLAGELADRFREVPGVEVVHGDFLEIPLARLTDAPEEVKVVGNIPYNRTAPILFRLLERPRPARIVLTVQREVADRILAPPGGRAYGALAVGVRSVAAVRRVANVPRGAFRPVPRVDSAVLVIEPHRPAPLDPGEERELRELTRTLFQRRRKQVQRILRDAPGLRLSPEAVEAVGRRTGLDLRDRPERLSPDDVLRLARALREAGGPGSRPPGAI